MQYPPMKPYVPELDEKRRLEAWGATMLGKASPEERLASSNLVKSPGFSFRERDSGMSGGISNIGKGGGMRRID